METVSIAKKIFINFGLILLILMGLTAFSVKQLLEIDIKYTSLIDNESYKIVEVSKIQNAVSLQGLYIRSYLLDKNSDNLEKIYAQRDTINEILNEIEPLFVTAEMQEEFRNIKEQQGLYSDYAKEVIQYVDNNQLKEAHDILLNSVVPTDQSIQQSINTIVDFQTKEMNTANDDATASTDTTIISLIIAALVDIILAIILGVLMTRHITIPLNRLTQAANVMATGDLRGEGLVVNTKDEIQELAQAFNTMKSNLVTLLNNAVFSISNTTTATKQLATSIDEISVVTDDIAKRMEKVALGGGQAAATGNECAIATDETAQGVGRIADAAQALHTQAMDTQSMADEGGHTLQIAEQQIAVIQTSSYETREKVKQLSRQSAEIENIIQVITDITDQTNLLALNAAIEAARAGEHGKGFAVVADEVRQLAEESKNSAAKIVELTAHIQTDTKAVEESVNITVQNIDQGVTCLQNAQTSFHSIVGSITDMTAQIQEISASTEEISASTEQIAASVSEMAHTSNNTAEESQIVLAAVEEQTATMHEINAVAKSLSEGAAKAEEEINQYQF